MTGPDEDEPPASDDPDGDGPSPEDHSDGDGPAPASGEDSEGADERPERTEIDSPFGEGEGGPVEVATDPGVLLTEGYWFRGQEELATPPGTAFLWATSAAGLYAASYVFAAVGLQFLAPATAGEYMSLVFNAMFFLPYPIVAYLAGGLALELSLYRDEGGLPETAITVALLVPVVFHVSLFFVEWIDTGYTEATLADHFSRDPLMAQLLLWPPVVVGTVYAVIAYRANLDDREVFEEADSLRDLT